MAHGRGRAGHTVQSGVVHHLDDGAHPAALLADRPAERTVVLDLGGGVGPVAQLVLQALQVQAVAGAVRQHAGDEQARHAAGRLRQRQEHVRHRGRGEPLVPGESVGAVAGRLGARGVRADVRTTLLLGHRHARDQAPLAGRRAQPVVVLGGRQQRFEGRGQVGAVPQGGHGRVGHRDRAGVARLHLTPDVELRRARHVRTGLLPAPRRGVQAVRDGHRHQVVPVRVELDLVDAVPHSVVRTQHGRILVDDPAPLLGALAARQHAELADLALRPARALPVQAFEQRGILGDVVVGEGGDLVGHLMGRWHGVLLTRGG